MATNNNLTEKLCGFSNPFTLKFNTSVTVSFISDYSGRFTGFKADYQISSPKGQSRYFSEVQVKHLGDRQNVVWKTCTPCCMFSLMSRMIMNISEHDKVHNNFEPCSICRVIQYCSKLFHFIFICMYSNEVSWTARVCSHRTCADI